MSPATATSPPDLKTQRLPRRLCRPGDVGVQDGLGSDGPNGESSRDNWCDAYSRRTHRVRKRGKDRVSGSREIAETVFGRVPLFRLGTDIDPSSTRYDDPPPPAPRRQSDCPCFCLWYCPDGAVRGHPNRREPRGRVWSVKPLLLGRFLETKFLVVKGEVRTSSLFNWKRNSGSFTPSRGY